MTTDVIIGVDTHKDCHVAVAISATALHLAATAIPATSKGYQALETWAAMLGTIRCFGIEGTGSCVSVRPTPPSWVEGQG